MEPKVKGEIDLTDGIGEQHISQRPGITEGGTTDDDLNGESTDAWPSGLDKSEFTDLQQKVITARTLHPEATQTRVGALAGCSAEVVRQVRHKISAMGCGDAVTFDVPDEPNPNIKIVKPYLEDDTEGGNDNAATEEDSEEEPKPLPKDKILTLYRDGYPEDEIAEQVDREAGRIVGFIGAMKRHGKLPTQSEEAEETEEEDSEEEEEAERQPMESENMGTANLTLPVSAVVEIMESNDIEQQTKETILKETSI